MLSRVAVRTAVVNDAAAISRVHITSWQSSYRGFVPDSVLNNFDKTQERRLAWWQRVIAGEEGQQAVFVGLIDDEIVAFANAGPAREAPDGHNGEIYAIYSREHAQGKGFRACLYVELCRLSQDQWLQGCDALGFSRELATRHQTKVRSEHNGDGVIKNESSFKPIPS